MNRYIAALFVILWPAYWALVYVWCRDMGWALLMPGLAALTTYWIGWEIIRIKCK